jgi:spore coat protein A
VDRACVHLHGGLVPWTVDGGPWAWFRANGEKGISFMNPGPTPNSADYFYPNDQSARLVWYHDHAVGITRLNAYAGLASAYIIRDPFEQLLIQTGIIPQAEIPLIIQDKTFKTESDDYGNPGDLHYTISYDPNAFELAPPANPPVPSCVPEFFADTILVNGAAYPFVDVEPRRYRFRILNGANARFFNLQLYYAQNGNETEANLAAPGPAFIQFGTEGGFLPQPVVLNAPPKMMAFDPVTGNATAYTLLLAPAERADVIIDFSNVPVGSKLILWNDSPAPFPAGDPSISNPGTGPDTSTLLQFRVVPRTGARDRFDFNRTLLALKFALAPFALQKLPPAFAAGVRDLTLNEDFDEFGRLRQLIGTNVKIDPNAASYGRAYADLATEVVKKGSIEVWRIANLSGDTHPIHFHLVNVQILSRQPFDAVNYNGTPLYTGPKTLPDPNERGWKETVRMNPGEVITCIMKFDLAKVPFPVPMSPRTGGHEYVYHCHILEHEEHDMMRPLVVK